MLLYLLQLLHSISLALKLILALTVEQLEKQQLER